MIRLDVTTAINALGSVTGIVFAWAILKPAMGALESGFRKNGGQ